MKTNKSMLLNRSDHEDSFLYLQTIGFNIVLHFLKAKFQGQRKEFISFIKYHYKNFIISSRPKNIDLLIDFIDEQKTDILIKNTNKFYFVNFFHWKSSQQITTYYLIHPLYLQIILRHALLALLSKRKGFIIHASGNLIHNKVAIFIGKSGIGKSTINQALNNSYPTIADDMICIKKDGCNYVAYQTPFMEKISIIKSSRPFPITAFFFIKRGQTNIKQINNKDFILSSLLPHIWAEKQYLTAQGNNVSDFVKNFNKFFIFSTRSPKDIIPLFENRKKFFYE